MVYHHQSICQFPIIFNYFDCLGFYAFHPNYRNEGSFLLYLLEAIKTQS